jgi:hypothetical protein
MQYTVAGLVEAADILADFPWLLIIIVESGRRIQYKWAGLLMYC